MSKTEYRSSSWEAGKDEKITGYAVVFDQRTVLYKDPITGLEYGEIIDRHALDGADLSDVILRYDHEGRVLARTRNGSLRLAVDDHGLLIEADMSSTDEARNYYNDVKAGLIDKMSFAFTASGEEWDQTSRTRKITSIERLFDVSLVSFPAYEQTEVHVRSAFEALAEPDRKAYREAETRAILSDIEQRMGRYSFLFHAEPDDFMTRTEVAAAAERNKSLPPLARRKIDHRDPIFREMLEIRSGWNASVGGDPQKAREMQERFAQLEKELKNSFEGRTAAIQKVIDGEGEEIKRFYPKEGRKDNQMENIEIRAFQKFVTEGSLKNLTAEERAGLATSGAGAVMPTEIYDRMITNGKYSDLLSRATVTNLPGAGTVKIPIASDTEATWKAELQPVDPTAPTLTSLDLGGKELMRVIQYSAAVEHMTAEQFTTWMADLCASEVVETLEAAFITGNEGTDAPHDGLQHLTWTPNTNEVEATGQIAASDVAKALSLLPQKYARNAILLMNANTAYNTVGLFKGTNEYAYSMADGATRFMGKEIHISEYCADNEIYIIDPAQLYVRFAMQPVIEVDKSVGFLSAANTMRCLTVVDFAWNTAAAVRVGLSG